MDTSMRSVEIRDIDELMVIDAECFANPWHRNVFLEFLGSISPHLYVIEGKRGQMIGYVAIQFGYKWIKIMRMCVAPEYRRKMYGTLALGWLKSRLINFGGPHRTQLRTVVRTNDQALGFFAANDFIAISVYRGYFLSSGQPEDGLLLRWSTISENNSAKLGKLDLHNRISKHYNA